MNKQGRTALAVFGGAAAMVLAVGCGGGGPDGGGSIPGGPSGRGGSGGGGGCVPGVGCIEVP